MDPETGGGPTDGAQDATAPPGSSIPLAYVMLGLTALFWGGTTVAARAAAGDIPPLTLTFWRWAVALVLFLPFGWRPWWRNRARYARH